MGVCADVKRQSGHTHGAFTVGFGRHIVVRFLYQHGESGREVLNERVGMRERSSSVDQESSDDDFAVCFRSCSNEAAHNFLPPRTSCRSRVQ